MNLTLLKRLSLTCLLVVLSACAGQELQQQGLLEQQKHTQHLETLQTLTESQAEHLLALQETLARVEGQLQDLNEEVTELQYSTATLQEKIPNAMPIKPHQVTAAAKTEKPTVLASAKVSLGRVEWVWVDLLNQYLKGRVDTGAKSSSIHATDIQYFERDGKDWVKFKLHTHEKTAVDDTLEEPIYEAPLVRSVKIKQASSESYEKRAVIKLKFRLGDIMDEAEFSLTDRANMNYPVLLGRNVLRDVAIVDVSKTFTQKRKK